MADLRIAPYTREHVTHHGGPIMHVTQSFPDAVLTRKPDRRGEVRFVHHERVRVDGRPALACNISRRGLAVVMTPEGAAHRLHPGDVVEVTFRGDVAGAGLGAAQARVARVETNPGRLVAGLQLLRR